MPNQIASRASLTLPNLITLVRILLTPLFIIFLIQGSYRKALVIFLLAGLSDLADGLIARHWQQKTPLGTILDPLADKLLLSSSFVTLSIFPDPFLAHRAGDQPGCGLGLRNIGAQTGRLPPDYKAHPHGEMDHHLAIGHGAGSTPGKNLAYPRPGPVGLFLAHRRANGRLRGAISL